MNEPQQKWFAIGVPGNPALHCPACSQAIALEPMADHHPTQCPNCGIECAFLNWKEQIVMILPGAAPARLTEVIRWLQTHFDELDYVELLCALEEISADIDKACAPQDTPGVTAPGPTRRC